jgi:hypothetical protein
MSFNEMKWRTGRKVGRTIYAQAWPDARDTDVLIGMMDSPALARQAVEDHNAMAGHRETTRKIRL